MWSGAAYTYALPAELGLRCLLCCKPQSAGLLDFCHLTLPVTSVDDHGLGSEEVPDG